MGLLKIFKGGIKLPAGLQPKGDFPLMEAHDIVVDEDGTRLDEKLKTVGNGSVVLDKTLSQEGQAADAKAVGDRINQTVGNINDILETI